MHLMRHEHFAYPDCHAQRNIFLRGCFFCVCAWQTKMHLHLNRFPPFGRGGDGYGTGALIGSSRGEGNASFPVCCLAAPGLFPPGLFSLRICFVHLCFLLRCCCGWRSGRGSFGAPPTFWAGAVVGHLRSNKGIPK